MVIEIEVTKDKQINYNNIKRIIYGINERYGNDVTVKFAEDWTYTIEVNK